MSTSLLFLQINQNVIKQPRKIKTKTSQPKARKENSKNRRNNKKDNNNKQLTNKKFINLINTNCCLVLSDPIYLYINSIRISIGNSPLKNNTTKHEN